MDNAKFNLNTHFRRKTMPVINILAPHVADMIAAGEVVERPASVVKELVENAFDAGAKNICVEIKDGGATFIRVTDDGCGMAPEDAGIAFLRHATSKLKDEKGLEAIGTMGFRGEALAAISAVSHIELRTRKQGCDGTVMSLSAGDILDMSACGCPIGTVMTVRDIFFNTPARLKFLKSDRSEATACMQAALRCALGRPDVSLRFIRDGREEFFSAGDGKVESCVYALLGRDISAAMLPCLSEGDSMGVSGLVSSPALCRGNRAAQYFFCNGRYIRSTLLQSAVEQAYKNSMLTGRFPACVLYLDIGLGNVDVNVHPAKTEVKFSSEKQVFDLVYHAVRMALENEDRSAAGAEPEPVVERRLEPMPEPVYRPAPAPPSGGKLSFKSPSVAYRPAAFSPPPLFSTKNEEKSPVSTGFEPVFTPLTVEKPVQNVESLQMPDHKIVGEALKTYIIVERDEELILIDKHAAHERMIFDSLKAQAREIMAQSLLCPVTLSLSPEDGELLENNGELLQELGFEIEPFGEREFIIRALPADMDPPEAAAAVEEICEKLRAGKAPDPASARDEILHTVACKAAIKAGWDTDKKELERLVEAVVSGRVKYCPHGRPVSVVVTRRDLDKRFKRIV